MHQNTRVCGYDALLMALSEQGEARVPITGLLGSAPQPALGSLQPGELLLLSEDTGEAGLWALGCGGFEPVGKSRWMAVGTPPGSAKYEGLCEWGSPKDTLNIHSTLISSHVVETNCQRYLTW